MTEVITCNIQLIIGEIYELRDKHTKLEGKGLIIREATKEEYLSRTDIENPIPLSFYYEVSID